MPRQSKLPLLVAVLALVVAATGWAPAQDNGLKPRVDKLEADVRSLSQALKAIELTPGPQGVAGPQGVQGPTGLQGAQGPAGTPSNVTVNVEGLAGSAASDVPLLAGFEIFTRIDSIPGESTEATHRDWIDTLGYSFGVTQTATGGVGGAGAGKASFQDFKILKVVDKATPRLLLRTAMGSHLSEVVVEVGRRSEGGFQLLLKYKLQEVIITSLTPAGASGGNLLEEVSFNYAKVTITYYQYDVDGSTAGTAEEGWDVLRNQPI